MIFQDDLREELIRFGMLIESGAERKPALEKHLNNITKLVEGLIGERDLTAQILRMENKKLGGCLETILKTIKQCKTAKYYDETDMNQAKQEIRERLR